jgi:hypothetical protein
MPSADEIRDVQRATWAGLSGGWEKWDSVIMDQLGPVGAAMIESLVLKPGGRLCASVWVKPEENPWTAIAMQAIATEADVTPADPDGPNMYRCAAPGYVSALYEGAGLRDVAEWDVEVELVTRSPEQYWEMISEHVSLAVVALQRVDEPARGRIRASAIAKVSAFEKDGKTRVPGVARCIVGTKQDSTATRPRDGARSSSASLPTQP